MIVRRHHLIGVIRNNPLPYKRFVRITRDDGGTILAFCKCSFRGVETEVRFAGISIESMTGEAMVRENGTDVTVEGQLFLCRERRKKESRQRDVGQMFDRVGYATILEFIAEKCLVLYAIQAIDPFRV